MKRQEHKISIFSYIYFLFVVFLYTLCYGATLLHRIVIGANNRFFLLPASKFLINYQFIIYNHLSGTINNCMTNKKPGDHEKPVTVFRHGASIATVPTVVDIPDNVGKLFQRYKNISWKLVGYSCPVCHATFRYHEPLRKHLSRCEEKFSHVLEDYEDIDMPVKEVKNSEGKIIGYRWGSTGKIYRKREDAERQARAIYASGYKEKK